MIPRQSAGAKASHGRFEVKTTVRDFVLRAKTKQDAERWLRGLKLHVRCRSLTARVGGGVVLTGTRGADGLVEANHLRGRQWQGQSSRAQARPGQNVAQQSAAVAISKRNFPQQ